MDSKGRPTRRRLIMLDGIAATAYLLLLVPAAALRAGVPHGAAVPLIVAVGAPVALRRVRPTPVFLFILAASATAWSIDALPDPFVAAAFALYPVALAARRAVVPTVAIGAVAAVILAVSAVAGPLPVAWQGFGTVFLGAGLSSASWTAGRLVRDRRAETAHAAAELAGRAVAEERLRIARELHDVVAHSMSLIAIKAGTANHVMSVRPGEAQDALRVIETTSRAAMTEIRQLLGVLRADPPPSPSGGGAAMPLGGVVSSGHGEVISPSSGLAAAGSSGGVVPSGRGVPGRETAAGSVAAGPATSHTTPSSTPPGLAWGWQATFGLRPAELAPTPGMAGLPALAECAEQAGVSVDMVVRGVERLPDGVAVSVYRIVQEALTNVVRHAAPATCRVSVVRDDGEVRVEVTDDGPGTRVLPAAGRTGHGLVGMRERALMYGGELHAAPRAEGGFAVSARIPCEP